MFKLNTRCSSVVLYLLCAFVAASPYRLLVFQLRALPYVESLCNVIHLEQKDLVLHFYGKHQGKPFQDAAIKRCCIIFINIPFSMLDTPLQ